MRVVLPVVTVVALGLAGLSAQQPPPGPGQLRPRPGTGREPEFPAPKITDYKPRSTLVVPQHLVPRAKYPVIDIHGHPPALVSAEVIKTVVDAMDPLNLRVVVQANGASGDRLKQQLDAIRANGRQDRLVMFTSVDFRSIGPGFGSRAAQQLEADIKAGALGLGEIGKDLGMRIRKPDGTRLKLDDPELDQVWDTCARLKVPVFIHTADPAEFFQPLDYTNERWLEMALFRDRRYFDRSQFPAFEELMEERDRLLAKHPRTTFVLAHLGWHANDLARLGRMFDKLPNVSAEVGAVLYDLGRQPRTAHEFFVKYQDRILFGKDSYQPDEYPYYWRTFETADEYFDYYRDYHAFWKLYGMALPDEVLKKLYYKNALTLVPGLPQDGFPR
jgi:predicted TIM-barrel fold metal-dependent hydrolase